MGQAPPVLAGAGAHGLFESPRLAGATRGKGKANRGRMPTTTAMIGAGVMGRIHLGILCGLEGAKLVALVEPDAAARDAVSRRVRNPGIRRPRGNAGGGKAGVRGGVVAAAVPRATEYRRARGRRPRAVREAVVHERRRDRGDIRRRRARRAVVHGRFPPALLTEDAGHQALPRRGKARSDLSHPGFRRPRNALPLGPLSPQKGILSGRGDRCQHHPYPRRSDFRSRCDRPGGGERQHLPPHRRDAGPAHPLRRRPPQTSPSKISPTPMSVSPTAPRCRWRGTGSCIPPAARRGSRSSAPRE